MLPVSLTRFPQIRAKRHPEASVYLQVQLVRPTVNTATHSTGSPFCPDAFIVSPQTHTASRLVLHPNRRVCRSLGVSGRLVLRVLVLHRCSQRPLHYSFDCRRHRVETLDCRPRKSPGPTREVEVNNTQVRQLGLISCTFRQTNIVWLFYGYISSQLTFLRFRRDGVKLPDPPALTASPGVPGSFP